MLDGSRVELRDREGGSRIWEIPSIAEGSHHPEWFAGVIEEFLEEVERPGRRGRNLEEAELCATLLAVAQESSRRGGASLPVPA